MSTVPIREQRGRTLRRERVDIERLPSTPFKSESLKITPLPQKRVSGCSTYPPYIPIPNICPGLLEPHTAQTALVEGATCRLIFQLFEEGRQAKDIIKHLDQAGVVPEERARFCPDDIHKIVKSCRMLGLSPFTALESEAWNPEESGQWWIDEDSRQNDSPVTLDECGSTGWWRRVRAIVAQHPTETDQDEQIESARNRNWVRWPSPQIGPPKFEIHEDF